MKKYLIYGLIVLGLMGISFLFGKFLTPVKVIEKQVVVEKEKIKYVDRFIENDTKTKDLEENTKTHTETVVVKQPDGTETTTIKTDTETGKVVKEVETKFIDRTVEVEKVVEKQVIVTKEITSEKPNWNVSARVGTNISRFKLNDIPLNIGVGIDRRIVGPIKVGLWSQTDTKFTNISGGLSLSIEF